MRKFLFFLILLLISTGISFTQNISTIKNLFKDADYDISQEDYEIALNKLLRIYKYDSLNANVNYLIGLCFVNTINKKTEALKYLSHSVTQLTPAYKQGMFEEKKAPYDALLLYGDALSRNLEFEKAMDQYFVFKAKVNQRDIEKLNEADRKIRNCEFAKVLIKYPVGFNKQIIPGLSSGVSDYNPVVTPDESSIFFTSEQLTGKRTDERRIYYSYKKGDKWLPSQNITEVIGSDYTLATVFLSSNGKTLLFCDDDESKQSIYESKLEMKRWRTPKRMMKKINSGGSQSFASMTKNEKIIYFSSNRKGGYGGYDIYKIEKKGGDWTEPINMGPKVNTHYNDINPIINTEGSRLVFASEGLSSMGGYDLFYVELQKDGICSEPMNFGYPVNTPGDNTYIWPNEDGCSGYMFFTDPNTTTEYDLYRVTIVPNKEISFAFSDLDKMASQYLDTGKIAELKQKITPDDTTHTDILPAESDTSTLMTILIKVTKNPLESSYLREIEGVKAYRCADGTIRYYYGQYYRFEDAARDFDKILKVGFYSAQLKNVSEDTLYFHASSDLYFTEDHLSDSNNLITEDNSKNEIKNQSDDSKKGKDIQSENEIEKQKQVEQDQKNKEIEKQKIAEENKLKKEQELIKKNEDVEKKKDKVKIYNETDGKFLNDITEQLLNAEDDIFTIQIATVAKTGNAKYLQNVSYATEHECKDGMVRYTTGVFKSEQEAAAELRKLRQAGYKDAYVINFKKLKSKFYNEEDISDHIRTYNLKPIVLEAITEETRLYSIQIASSIKQAPDGYFSELPNVKEKQTPNGYFKYYYGKFKGYPEAKAEVEKARNLGYKDAFIIKYSEADRDVSSETKDVKTDVTVEKSSETDDKNKDDSKVNAASEITGTYTIQVASSKKRAATSYFKGLEIVEIEGNNGWFIYISGSYDSLKDARAALKKVVKIGFDDAFINRSSKYNKE